MAYQTYNAMLKQCITELSAAEAHGIATGLLCVNSNTTSANWLVELSHNTSALDAKAQQQLIELFTSTQQLLAADDFEFTLFLPDEEQLLTERVNALKQWCQGFLYALGSLSTNSRWSKEAQEIVRDLTEFTKLDADAEGEDDERDFVEVTEYCRTAVLILRAELLS